MEPGWITNRQIEASRVALTREMKRGGKVWIRIFPDKPITKKPAETRMGKGKGNPEGWVAVVKPGPILFELDGVTEELAKKAFALAQAKLSVKIRFVRREENDHGGGPNCRLYGTREMTARTSGRQAGRSWKKAFRLRFRSATRSWSILCGSAGCARKSPPDAGKRKWSRPDGGMTED